MNKFVDHTGKQFGRLTALNLDPARKHHWVCRCDCGAERSVRAAYLVSGHTQSCGCLQREMLAALCALRTGENNPNFVDHTGKQFGRLTALKLDPERKYRWICRCECGEERSVLAALLVSGHTQSCGCLQREMSAARTGENSPCFVDHTGKKFGRLTALHSDPARREHWICRCSCGAEKSVSAGSLVSGRTKSCGCLARELSAARTGENNPHWNSDLTKEDRLNNRDLLTPNSFRQRIYARDGFRCTLCGANHSFHAHHMEPWSKNKERRNEPDNLVTICRTCHDDYHRIYPARIANSENFITWFRERRLRFERGELKVQNRERKTEE